MCLITTRGNFENTCRKSKILSLLTEYSGFGIERSMSPNKNIKNKKKSSSGYAVEPVSGSSVLECQEMLHSLLAGCLQQCVHLWRYCGPS